MKIGILGAGNVGGTLGSAWARAGHDVCFGSRQPNDARIADLVKSAGARASAVTPSDAVARGDVVLIATPWDATRQALTDVGRLSGKILLDATNPLQGGLAGLDFAGGRSGAEQVAAWAPGARVVKIFNTVGFNVMANPRFGAERASMLYCGDDGDAKKIAAELAAAIGFDPVDAGPLAEARWLESFALLWIRLAVVNGQGREIAFRLMKR
jgi:8-hydroxy-5-deazaflavin:NADPH oxidoreductase